MDVKNEEQKQEAIPASRINREVPARRMTFETPHDGVGKNLPMLNRLSWQPEYSENEFSGVEVCSAFENEPSEQSGDNAMRNIARCFNNKNFKLSLEDIIMSTTKLQSVERAVAIPCEVDKNTTQGISNLNLSYPNSQKTQQELTGAIMSKSQITPVVSKTAGVIMKLKVIGQKLMTGLTKLGSQEIPDGVEAELTNIAEQKSSAANEGYIIMCQDKNKSHIATQNSKMEKTGQSTGPIRGSLATQLRKATNYVAELGQSIQQNWLGGKVVARFATAFLFGVVVSGSMLFSNAADAQSAVSITNASTGYTFSEGDGTVNIPIEIDPAITASAVTATFSITAESATAGSDYEVPTSSTTPPNTAEIVAGATTGNIQIVLTDDDIDEADEVITVTITGVTAAGGETVSVDTANSTTLVTITDNDNAVSITDAATAKEVTEGTTTISIPIELEDVPDAAVDDVVVKFTTTIESGQTATAGTDFTDATDGATNNTATITTDGTNKTGNIVVTITDDSTDEPVENFTVTITEIVSGPGALSRTDAELTTIVNINDNDNAVSITDAATAKTVTEGPTTTISIPIELEDVPDAAEADVVVKFTTTIESGQTATADTDFD